MAGSSDLVGLQGSGKTTYYRTNIEPTHALLSLDVQKTRSAFDALLNKYVAEQRSFAIDNTNVTRQVRAPYIRKAKEAGYRVVGCHLDVPTRTPHARNKNRTHKKAIPVARPARRRQATGSSFSRQRALGRNSNHSPCVDNA